MIRKAPAIRSGGTSAERGTERGEQPRAVGLAVGRAGFDHPHVEIGNAASRSVSAARASSVCLARLPKFWLGLLSITTATTEGIGSRSSRVKDGLASARTSKRQRGAAQQRAAAAE